MAKINKKQAVKRSQGLPTAEALVSHAMGDQVQTQMQTADGGTAEVGLTEGEFVWSIPAIIALGKGSHEEGTALLEKLHNELKSVGDQIMQEQGQQQPQQGLAGAEQLV